MNLLVETFQRKELHLKLNRDLLKKKSKAENIQKDVNHGAAFFSFIKLNFHQL